MQSEHLSIAKFSLDSNKKTPTLYFLFQTGPDCKGKPEEDFYALKRETQRAWIS